MKSKNNIIFTNICILLILVAIIFLLPDVTFAGFPETINKLVGGSGGGDSKAKLSITTMLANLMGTWRALFGLANTFAYVAGVFFCGYALHKMAKMGQPGQQGSTMSGVIFPFVAGVCLIALPFLVSAMGETLGLGDLYGTGKDISLTKHSELFGKFRTSAKLNSQGAEAFKSIVFIIQLVGFFAVIRSFLLLKALGASQGGQQVSVTKILLHFIPGVGLMYILKVADMFLETVTIT